MANAAQALAEWIKTNTPRLRHCTVDEVANAFADFLETIDGRLGVEVSREPQTGTTEAILTAYSDPELFGLVHTAVEMLPNLSGWRIVALKPARGFSFRITLGRHSLSASELRFASLPDVRMGFVLLPPLGFDGVLPAGAEAEELAWLIVETGVGEELAARIQHLELATSVRYATYPIVDFEKYLQQVRADDH